MVCRKLAVHARKGSTGLEKSLPSYYYTAAEIFQREQDLIFGQEWFCAGREEELPLPGQFERAGSVGRKHLEFKPACLAALRGAVPVFAGRVCFLER